MGKQIELRCRCGEVVGRIADVSRQKANRVICYCDDCQAFAHQLGRADILDAQGGTDIIQFAPADVSVVKGQQHIAGLRLSPKGLLRFHTTCCNTPIGNTLTPAIPFVGLVAQVIDAGPETPDAAFGAPLGAIFGKFAVGPPPPGSTGTSPSLLLRVLLKLLTWRLGGRARPHPFFKPKTREPVYPVTVLTAAQRDALRPLCGPKPAVVGAVDGE